MSQFTTHTRTNLGEGRPYVPGEDLSHVSIAEADVLKNGSPKEGDWIFRNPQDHDDQRLVSKAYYEENYAPVVQAPPGKAFVRIAVAVSSTGEWNACGWHTPGSTSYGQPDDKELASTALDPLDMGGVEKVYFLEAALDLPVFETVSPETVEEHIPEDDSDDPDDE